VCWASLEGKGRVRKSADRKGKRGREDRKSQPVKGQIHALGLPTRAYALLSCTCLWSREADRGGCDAARPLNVCGKMWRKHEPTGTTNKIDADILAASRVRYYVKILKP
jgi:hypothetical protein